MAGRRPAQVVALAVGVALFVTPLAACGGGGADGHHLTAYFERTVGLYESGDVQVMGMSVGHVDDIEIDGSLVRVEMTIDADVPLPADVYATIGQTQLIGERNIVLYPPWDAELEASGAAKLADGAVIPRERTVTPVEPDEGLAAFDDLARSLDGEVVREFVSDSAEVLDGRGEKLGRALDNAAGLTTALAEVDEQLLSAADDLHVLAASLRGRDEQLGRLVESFSKATEVLAAERDGIRGMLSSLVELTKQGQGILDVYGDQLPGDIATATALASIFERNTRSIDELLSTFAPLGHAIAAAYQPSIDGIYLRASSNATLAAMLDFLGSELLGVLP